LKYVWKQKETGASAPVFFFCYVVARVLFLKHPLIFNEEIASSPLQADGSQ
jgi:hypothetical protein